VLVAAVLGISGPVFAQGMGMPAPPEMNPVTNKPRILEKVGIDQRIGQQLPLSTPFVDDHGRQVQLGDFFGKRPVVLALAYYECPMLCTQVLNEMTGSLKTMNFTPGKDYDVVVISINPQEGPMLAKEKKQTYVDRFGRPETADGWHFLTGTDRSIHAVADAIGFHYAYDENIQQYAHAAAIYVTTAGGEVARYFIGLEYPPRSVRFALVEASAGRLGTVTDQVLLLCYHYDPATGKYGAGTLEAVRIGGVLTVVAMVAFIVVSVRRERSHDAVDPGGPAPHHVADGM
jgi:protein SCO1/2